MPDSYLKRLVDSFEARTDKIAMRIVGDDSQVYTFGQSLSRIRSVAYNLELEGVESSDRVAVIGENHPSWAIAYLGILYRGAVCVPLDPHGEIETLTNFIEKGMSPVPRSLRFVAVGGARVAPALIERARAVGLPVYEGYGLSECASVVALNTP